MPLEQHPTNPDMMVYRRRQYNLPNWDKNTMINCNVKYTITLDMREFDALVSSIEDVLNTFTTYDPYVWDQDPIADSFYRRQIDLLDNFKNDLLKVAVCKLDLGEEQ